MMVYGFETGSGRLTASYASNGDFTISPTSKTFASAGGSQQVTVTGSDYDWTASENLDWITLSTTSGEGNGSVNVTVAANNGAARGGTVTIAGQAFYVSQQSGSSLDVDVDEDGDGYTSDQGDCDDTDDTIFPGAEDICGDGIDQDCSGSDLSCTQIPDEPEDDGGGGGCFISAVLSSNGSDSFL